MTIRILQTRWTRRQDIADLMEQLTEMECKVQKYADGRLRVKTGDEEVAEDVAVLATQFHCNAYAVA